MPWNNGLFTRLHSWIADRDGDILIRADRMDEEHNNLAEGISHCLTKDGSNKPTAHLSFNDKKLIDLGDPVLPEDGTNKKYVDAQISDTTDVIDTKDASVRAYIQDVIDEHLAKADPHDQYALMQTIISQLVPVGSVSAYAASTVAEGWLLCDGAAVSRTSYHNLFYIIGDTYGEGDGSTTFNLPDYRGVFLRGVDSGRGLDADRDIGTYQEDAFKSHQHTRTADGRPAPSRANGDAGIDWWSAHASFYDANYNGSQLTGIAGSTETRPKNMAVHYMIKY